MDELDFQKLQATVLQLQSRLDLVARPDDAAVRSTGSCISNSCNTPAQVASNG